MRNTQHYLIAGWVLVAAGCGGPSSLSGTVTLDGAPLTGATVVLHPDTKDDGAELVVGSTNSDGRFVIRPAAGRSIARGTYKMTLSKRAEQTPLQARLMLPGNELVPAKYNDLAKNELPVINVPTSGDIVVELTSR